MKTSSAFFRKKINLTKTSLLIFLLTINFPCFSEATSSSAKKEAQKLYEKAKKALSTGNFKEAKSDFEILNTKYASLIGRENDEDTLETFGEFVPGELEKIECFLASETGDRNPSRTSKETLEQLLKAIASKDEAALKSLVSCDVSEGKPEGEFDQTSRDTAVQHLLGNDKKDGYGFIEGPPSKYKYVGKRSDYDVISIGADFVGFIIKPSRHAPKTARVQLILWGKP